MNDKSQYQNSREEHDNLLLLFDRLNELIGPDFYGYLVGGYGVLANLVRTFGNDRVKIEKWRASDIDMVGSGTVMSSIDGFLKGLDGYSPKRSILKESRTIPDMYSTKIEESNFELDFRLYNESKKPEKRGHKSFHLYDNEGKIIGAFNERDTIDAAINGFTVKALNAKSLLKQKLGIVADDGSAAEMKDSYKNDIVDLISVLVNIEAGNASQGYATAQPCCASYSVPHHDTQAAIKGPGTKCPLSDRINLGDILTEEGEIERLKEVLANRSELMSRDDLMRLDPDSYGKTEKPVMPMICEVRRDEYGRTRCFIDGFLSSYDRSYRHSSLRPRVRQGKKPA